MTVKLIALYTQPENPTEFDQKYFGTHVPLIEKVPGLLKMEVAKVSKNLMGGATPYYMIAELTFESMDALNAAMSSPEGQAAGQNIMSFAASNVTLLASELANTQSAGVL
jgi:uncharacterized protein (TIGR02118 family)